MALQISETEEMYCRYLFFKYQDMTYKEFSKMFETNFGLFITQDEWSQKRKCYGLKIKARHDCRSRIIKILDYFPNTKVYRLRQIMEKYGEKISESAVRGYITEWKKKMNMNVVVISGNIVRDAEVRETANTTVCNFTVAVNESYKKDDKWENRPNFINCVIFGRKADGVKDRIVKGEHITVNGRLHWSQYETKDGAKREKVEVYCDSLELPFKGKSDQTEQVIVADDCPF